MFDTRTTAEVIFWLSLFLISFAYFINPMIIWLFSRFFGQKPIRPAVSDDHLPAVSLLIVARDEEKDIRERIENALALDYPSDKLEIVIASDGSTDRTASIVGSYANRGVKLFEFEVNRGKAPVLNEVIPQLKGEVVLFSDANTSNERASAKRLAAWFQDSKVGAVCGRLNLKDPETGKNVDGLYWKYETFLKKCESSLGALLGSNGGIYALRKELYQPIPANTIVDDFVIPLLARKKFGCKIVYDSEAVAVEETPKDIRQEFRRRARIGAGGFQSIGILKGLLNPVHGWVSYAFWTHKILRWFCPFFMLAAIVTNLMLLELPVYQGMAVAQVGFYVLAAVAVFLPPRPIACRIARLTSMFTYMNLALFVGFFRWLFGRQKAAWARTARSEGEVLESHSGMPLLTTAGRGE